MTATMKLDSSSRVDRWRRGKVGVARWRDFGPLYPHCNKTYIHFNTSRWYFWISLHIHQFSSQSAFGNSWKQFLIWFPSFCTLSKSIMADHKSNNTVRNYYEEVVTLHGYKLDLKRMELLKWYSAYYHSLTESGSPKIRLLKSMIRDDTDPCVDRRYEREESYQMCARYKTNHHTFVHSDFCSS